MNSIWNNNLQAFSQRFPQLALYYNSFTKTFNENFLTFWQVTNAKNGELTVTENGIRLHSAYTPQKEAYNLINNSKTNILSLETETIVLYGFGLGYNVIQLAELLLNDAPLKKVVLVEPDFKHFFGALAYLDWTNVFKLKNLVLAVGCTPEELLSITAIARIHQHNSVA